MINTNKINDMKLKNFKALAVLIIATVLVACGGGSDKKAELEKLKAEYATLGDKIKALETEIAATDTTKVAKTKDVVVTEIQPVPFSHYIDVQGYVDADESVDIRPILPGKVMRVNVDEGDQVSAGQVLAEIDHDVLTKQLASLQPQYDLAVDVYNRQKRLWDQKIGSEIQLLQSQTQKESLEKQIETIKENIDMYLIKSPISGTVDFVGIKVGELASAGVTPAFSVINLSGLKVSAEIAESYSSKVKKGNPVLLHFPDLNKDTQAKITFVERSISTLTRSFKIEADLVGENSEYHPNMVSVVKIIDYENPSALVVPINAVQTINGEEYVYKAVIEGNGSVARKVKVTTGVSYDGKTEITSGLAANDKIVTSGQNELADGMNIKF